MYCARFVSGVAYEYDLVLLESGVSCPWFWLWRGFGYGSCGRVAQLVERLLYTQVVIGSSPVAPIVSLSRSSLDGHVLALA